MHCVGSQGSFLGCLGHERGFCLEAMAGLTQVEAWIWGRGGTVTSGGAVQRGPSWGICEGGTKPPLGEEMGEQGQGSEPEAAQPQVSGYNQWTRSHHGITW